MKKMVICSVLLGTVLLACSEKDDGVYNPPAFPGGGDAGPSPQADASFGSTKEHAMLREIVAKEPGNKNAWIKLGNLAMDSRRFQEAVDAYEKALALDPENVDVRVDMGTCYRSLGNPARAIEEYRKAIEIRPSHLYAHKNLGVVLAYDLHRYDEAIKAFQTYLKLSPNAPDALQVSNLINELKTARDKR